MNDNGPLFMIDIASAIHLVFTLNNEIIVHHMMTFELSDDGWVDRAILKPDHSLGRITE